MEAYCKRELTRQGHNRGLDNQGIKGRAAGQGPREGVTGRTRDILGGIKGGGGLRCGWWCGKPNEAKNLGLCNLILELLASFL